LIDHPLWGREAVRHAESSESVSNLLLRELAYSGRSPYDLLPIAFARTKSFWSAPNHGMPEMPAREP
jgi:hypothetical protein